MTRRATQKTAGWRAPRRRPRPGPHRGTGPREGPRPGGRGHPVGALQTRRAGRAAQVSPAEVRADGRVFYPASRAARQRAKPSHALGCTGRAQRRSRRSRAGPVAPLRPPPALTGHPGTRHSLSARTRGRRSLCPSPSSSSPGQTRSPSPGRGSRKAGNRREGTVLLGPRAERASWVSSERPDPRPCLRLRRSLHPHLQAFVALTITRRGVRFPVRGAPRNAAGCWRVGEQG